MATTAEKSVNKSDISSFIQNHSDIIIVSDTEGFMPQAQIDKIMEYSASASPSNGVIFNGDTLDYTITFGTEKDAKDVINSENACALKLLKALVEGMTKQNRSVVCNIGNRDLNKIKLLALLLTNEEEEEDEDEEKKNTWWTNGNTYKEIATNLLEKFKSSRCKANFWRFNDLKTINPYWNTKNSAFNPRWNSTKEIIATTLFDRYEYIFGADPGKGTISAPNNIDYMPVELDIKTNDDELKAAIVFTMYARMLFMKYEPKPGIFQYDGILREYLLKSNAASYAFIDKNLLLFGHGGFTDSFFEKESAVKILKDILLKNQNQDRFDTVQDLTYKPLALAQSGGSFNIKVEKIQDFDNAIQDIMKSLLDDPDANVDLTSEKYIKDKKGRKYLSDELSILNILCTPASNHDIFKEDSFKQYTTELSPIQVSTPIKSNLAQTSSSEPAEFPYPLVYNIFSHIPKGFGYSFGKSGSNTHFINTDFSNSFFKDVTLLDDYNNNYLLLHLKCKQTPQPQFVLEGDIKLNLYPSVNDDFTKPAKMIEDDYKKIQVQLEIFKKQKTDQKDQNDEDYMNYLDSITDKDKDPKLLQNISYCPDNLKGTVKIKYNYSFNLDNPPQNPYKNLLFHGTFYNGEKFYELYSFNSSSFKKMMILMPFSLQKLEMPFSFNQLSDNSSLNKFVQGGARKLSKKNKKSKKQIHKKRAVRSRVQHRK
jgi:hypothetical protein